MRTGSTSKWRKFSLLRVVAYCLLTVAAVVLGWIHSVAFVSVLSLVALIEGSISAWRSDVPLDDDTP